MELKELMDGLAAACGMDGLTADADGAYRLGFDDMEVSFKSVGSTQFAVWAEVCEPPPEGRERLCRMLMEAMFLGHATGGATFSIEPESGKVCLHRIEFLSALDVAAFNGLVEKFVNVLEEWRKIVTDFRPAAEALERKTAEASEVGRQSGMGLGGFMQV